MTNIKVLLGGRNENMRKISETLAKSDIASVFCSQKPMDILMKFMSEKPFAVMLEADGGDYCELAENLSDSPEPPHIYIVGNPQAVFVEERKARGENIHYMENIYNTAEIAEAVKRQALGVFKDSFASWAEFRKSCEEIVRGALFDLCFTANYKGAEYLHRTLVALCMSELKCSDSMCKTVYPYVAGHYEVSAASVERSMRTVIKRCWGNSSDDMHVKYFGFGFSKCRGLPTNREFVMILGDMLIHELQKSVPQYEKFIGGRNF
jgi:two-component system response regulator (stage 0 sporulation protein A)